MVFEHQDEYDSQWAAIQSIAEKIGCRCLCTAQAEAGGGEAASL